MTLAGWMDGQAKGVAMSCFWSFLVAILVGLLASLLIFYGMVMSQVRPVY